MLLDRVQKNITISKKQSDILRKDHLIVQIYMFQKLMDKLPDSLKKIKRKIEYLVNICLKLKENKIKNIGTNRYLIGTKKK